MGANGRRRVVITGLGAVTPLAGGVAASWERLIASRSAAGAISAFDASGFPVSFACEAKEFDRLGGSSTGRRGGWTASRSWSSRRRGRPKLIRGS